ncbi:MAG: adenylate cyclase [Planctomycetota bacterium]|jgi:adenylate cyclase
MANDADSFVLSYQIGGKPQTSKVTKDRVVIGRSPSSDLVIAEEKISRQHATIFREGRQWIIFDMDSANGTTINEKSIVKGELQHGDVIGLGELRLCFELPSFLTSAVHQVHFDSSNEKRNKTAILNMADLGLVSSIIESKSVKPDDGNQAAAWAISLFNQAAQAMLTGGDLNDVFAKVLDLVFQHLPVERGVIATFTEEDGLKPRVFKTRGNKMDQIRVSESIVNEVIQKQQAILVSDVLSDERFGAEASIMAMKISSAMCAPMYNDGRVSGVIYCDSSTSRKNFTSEELRLLSTLAIFAAIATERRNLEEDIAREQRKRERLEKYNSPAVVDRIVRGATSSQPSMDMIAEERDVTIVFTDLIGFTTISELMAPQEVAQLLNAIFERLTDAVFLLEGTLDKYMGDGMMAFFGAPLDQEDHARRAIKAGLLMQQGLAELNKAVGFIEPVGMRVGINTGPVVAGDIGSPKRRDYTVIGDAVNIASRLESSVAKEGQVVVGEATYLACKDLFEFEPLGKKSLKGKDLTVASYLVIREL